ncbi:hypothetical protein BDZ97DRAFT_1764248 [Flammula alnicola]|nr:hypothetical protein BDZ97DRAFT_1766107 [Flammula alnicola]KAF8955971.1 hypothetical protein BDZ97DRAFT_1764248 [Flammula alnicola]
MHRFDGRAQNMVLHVVGGAFERVSTRRGGQERVDWRAWLWMTLYTGFDRRAQNLAPLIIVGAFEHGKKRAINIPFPSFCYSFPVNIPFPSIFRSELIFLDTGTDLFLPDPVIYRLDTRDGWLVKQSDDVGHWFCIEMDGLDE